VVSARAGESVRKNNNTVRRGLAGMEKLDSALAADAG